ncbi:type VI secretion system baseplate subunit TssE [Pseudomonas sp. CBZ-4]|jgi:type VI secretion system protein|uniref:type VI secretion system baseplate subunit TssE n=1 Tax=Pseudomonas sp. CBZ-4 TaxID=1163065 RepID=UPI000349E93D|nr:type VI secretion system baseplate subunit TssE [Pseudomonas sp. CBZ-4]
MSVDHRSLFERLEQAPPTDASQVACIAVHLGKMLSTRAGSVQTRPDYGLPDFNDMRCSLHESLNQSRRQIEGFIQACEPRLASVQVRLLPRDRDPLVLAFVIDALLTFNGTTQPVAFRAQLGEAGRVEVLPDGL